LKSFIICIGVIFLASTAALAQQPDIVLEGSNEVTFSGPGFPSPSVFTALSTEPKGKAPENEWFVTASDAHILVHLVNGDSSLFIELSRKKPVFNFPADLAVPSDQSYKYNNFELRLTSTAGEQTEISFGSNSRLTVRVQELDATHLKLTFDGAMVAGSSRGTAASMPVKGSVSLRKNNPALPHGDSAAGCDNTIYNTWSPNADLGQWRSSTACETSMYHKVWAGFSGALQPALAYLQGQRWTCDPDKEKRSDFVSRARSTEPFTFRKYLGNGQGPIQRHCQLAPTDPKSATDSMAPVLALTQKLAQLMANPSPDGKLSPEAEAIANQLKDLGKGINQKNEAYVEIRVNEPPASKIDIPAGAIEKIGADGYVIRNTNYSGSTQGFDYQAAGGLYVLLGRWKEPHPGKAITIEPDVSTPQTLKIEALLLRFGTGSDLANTLLSKINMNGLKQVLQTAP
jgi:hypothetical protein